MGINVRSKGQRGEREVIQMLQPIVERVYGQMGRGAPPTLERNLMQTMKGGHDVVGLEWMALEVKRVENQNGLNGWWKQTLAQAKRCGGDPVLLYRPNNMPWKCRMRVGLRAGGKGATVLKATVTVDIATFLLYFEERLKWELAK